MLGNSTREKKTRLLHTAHTLRVAPATSHADRRLGGFDGRTCARVSVLFPVLRSGGVFSAPPPQFAKREDGAAGPVAHARQQLRDDVDKKLAAHRSRHIPSLVVDPTHTTSQQEGALLRVRVFSFLLWHSSSSYGLGPWRNFSELFARAERRLVNTHAGQRGS